MLSPATSPFSAIARGVVGHDALLQTAHGLKPLRYADWTASGRLYAPIEARLSETVGPYMANTHTETSATGQAMTLAYQEARQLIKRHVHAGPDDVLLATGTGCTGAINKLQRMLGLRVPSSLPGEVRVAPEARPLVLVTHMEHHSNHTTWLECLADVEVIPATPEGLVDLEAIPGILARHTGRALRIASVTACSNVTGIHTPYHEIAAIMHRHGGLCFVDFACSAPYVPIDMHPDDPAQALDAIFFSPHKFLGGPGACGILVFNRKLYRASVPDQPGGGTVTWTNPWAEHRYYEDIEVREDGGTPGVLQLIRAALAVQLKDRMGTGRMALREREIVRRVFAQLGTHPRVAILADTHRERLPVFSFYLDGLHYNLVVRLLNDRFGVQARGGCSCAGTYGHYLLNVDRSQSARITSRIDSGDYSDKPGWVRVSFHPVMDDAEVDAVCEAILAVADQGDAWAQAYEAVPGQNDYRLRDPQARARAEASAQVQSWFELA